MQLALAILALSSYPHFQLDSLFSRLTPLLLALLLVELHVYQQLAPIGFRPSGYDPT